MLFLIGFLPLLTTAVAAENATATVGWVGDPNGRGTFSLISSCLLTLGLCVWSAMHLNIPERRISLWRLGVSYVRWSLVGVFGPELVVFAAWRQLNSAKTLQQDVQQALNGLKNQSEQEEVHVQETSRKEKSVNSSHQSIELLNPSQNRETHGSSRQCEKPLNSPLEGIIPMLRDQYKKKWTLVHGFYAGMGGFTFDFESSPRPPELDSCLPSLRRLTLTARGVALLARCGHLPEVSKDEIDDKSKADHLAKTLICLQAAWMLIQVIGRATQSLPVTLLEINTLGHVLCTFVIYLLWWDKPAMIYEPTKLTGDWVAPLCAYMYMSSQISVWERDRPGIRRRAWLESELSALVYIPPKETAGGSNEGHPVEEHPSKAISHGSLQPRPKVSNSLASDPRRVSLSISKAMERVQNPGVHDLQRWRLAAEAIERYSAIASRVIESQGNQRLLTEELVTEYATNWPAEDLLRGTGGLIMGMILWFASMAFGAIHLSAWHADFPTSLERTLWRFSALNIAGSGLVWLLINLIASLAPGINSFWDNFVALKVHWIWYVLLCVVCSACGFAYVFARTFLVVEAFISIRALPRAAYDTPNWSQVIPHL